MNKENENEKSIITASRTYHSSISLIYVREVIDGEAVDKVYCAAPNDQAPQIVAELGARGVDEHAAAYVVPVLTIAQVRRKLIVDEALSKLTTDERDALKVHFTSGGY